MAIRERRVAPDEIVRHAIRRGVYRIVEPHLEALCLEAQVDYA